MKQKLHFATRWRHFSGQSITKIIFYHFPITNIAPPGGEIMFFCFIEATCRALSHAKQFFGYLYPKKLCDDLKQSELSTGWSNSRLINLNYESTKNNLARLIYL